MKKALLSRWFVRAVLIGAVIGVPPGFMPPARAQTAPAPGVWKIAPLKYRQRARANGLAVLSIENHQSPTVAIQVWYHVGGKDDPVGRSGFAHLFEHMMFKSTKNQKSENFDRLTEDVGGANNAFTQEDATVYHETVPSNYLKTLLWAEADRMANLRVNDENFVSERAVVEEEYRQSVLARPYGRLELYVERDSFAVHAYKRGVIGSIADLDSATIEDVRNFHETYYRPDNATLVVSGDFDPAQMDAWVDKYFGRIAKLATEIPRVRVTEPVRTKESRFNATGPNVPLPATAITYLLPPRKSDDADALRVAEVILGRGESSRMNQSLVYRQQIAASANANADLRDDAGLFELTIITAGGKPAADAERAALAELDKLKTESITAAELDKARNLLVSDVLRARETAEGQAFALGGAAVRFGDPERVNTDIARLQAITPADVQRVAQKYFTPENRVVIRYENGNEEQGGKSNAPKAALATAPSSFTPEETPPAPAAPRPVAFPAPIERKLPNGVRVVVIPRPGTGLASVSAGIQAGSVFDPNAAAGLADFTASLLTRGTKMHTAPQIAETVEALGGSLSSAAGWDSANVNLSSLSTRLGDALPTFAEVLRSPAFAAEEIERLRSEDMDGLAVSLREPGTLARLTAARVVFGDSGYGHSPNGTPETIKALDPGQINLFYRSRYQPQNTVLVFGGDIAPAAAFAYAAEYFGDWKAARIAAPRAPSPAVAQTGGRVVVVDKADAGQAAVYVVRPTIRRAEQEYAVGRVANSVLGEGYSSRLNQEVRIKRGLSYGAGSNLGTRKAGGFFSARAQTRNDAAPEVATLLKAELARLATDPVSTGELVPRKAALSGNYARELETGAGQGTDYPKPEPIRVCYPDVQLKNRAVYFCGVSDIVEPYPEWRAFKRQLTGNEWDYDFRRLFYTWTPDITRERFKPWVEIANRDKTCGWIMPGDLWVAPDGAVHLVWSERAIDTRMREKFFPNAKQSNAVNYAVVRDGKVGLRRTLLLAEEGGANEIPSAPRFQVTPDNRLVVIFYVGGTASSGKAVSENRVQEILPNGEVGPAARIPFQHPFISYFTATVRGGSRPSTMVELLGQRAGDPLKMCYARVRLW